MKCPLCRNTAELFSTGENREYQLCDLCGLIFVPSQFHIPIESERLRYQEHENSVENEGYVAMFMKKVSLIKKYCPKIKTALDFGCGYEPVLKVLLEREGLKTEIYDSIFFPDSPKNKSFDLVISTETFEHFKNPFQDIQWAINHVTPSGFLAVMTRFYPLENGKLSEEKFSKWYYKRDSTHIVFYSSKSFHWIADKMDLKIILNNQFDFVIMQRSANH